MNPKQTFCGSPAHRVDRRLFLQGGMTTALGVTLAGMGMPLDAAMAGAIAQKKKHVILIWLAGGASQFETFDPKPGRPTGGPFKAIQTKVPGMQICELMPKIAQLTDKMAIVRSLDTKIGDHGGAADLVQIGRRPEPAVDYPDIGTILAKELGQRDSQVPEYVSMYMATEGQPWGRPRSGFLGGRYAAMTLERSLKPENLDLPAGMSAVDHAEREHYRKYLSDRFNRERSAPHVVGYNSTFARVKGLMASDKLFDLEQEPAKVRERYGKTEFGQHCLVARRLIEAGTPVVKVSRAWWDTHSDNFESHRELVTELDHVMSTLIRDLEERGLLESTLIVTLSEFGRTPSINKDLGRDHFASAWSFSMTGCGVKGGAVFGKTDPDGRTVKDGKVGAGEVAATIYNAMGISHEKKYYLGARPIPIAPEHTQPIKDVLA
ncbi:DUF1501 domain-containing protein [Tuwongella immobilis]|uniref:DUF1501 domain-containing protein n=1 Tax=Tuwongella immobilis TaxID=692036 RepID=A0A6C2YN33_9BACT|nr:DUF1501 domain-containing protein [Tuwongella immobilis]VIP02475.1 hypothetical protein : Uncharacterized protein OS=Pirellula staleyi (strain ATCC 27377 / DSM 6068 / ICPB 4128) GN=Psta_0636 PE=4 SV=1: DUF1501 [Tuwongella immobilis]VTS01511.1 hypothetical protein : Uncharacterized protein OS=Pirellula staleyi (strain ATCC 27377 / DSM 6068 / ICPB 4128) GN=Psta_0636 PE=4 SV=1: DUF1501 [Tuwongella immobilis]